VLREQKKLKILQYAHRVFGINQKDDSAIDMAISATESFFRSLGLATRLSELEVDKSIIDEIEKRFTERNLQIGENHNVNGTIAKKILLSCY
ncbi:MAG: NADH-dependent alcohol dehydrogenase, partial [Bacteroidetes bacterium]|nr:NADH-dependent alcohol dehydrogenase [Bacteroidota bacterium]